MDRSKFTAGSPGSLVPCQNALGQRDWAFVPASLPPNWEMEERLWPLMATAMGRLGTLNGIGQKLPNPQLLLRPLQQQEAIFSSKIEGTYVTAQQLLLYELDRPDPRSSDDAVKDWIEVFNYTEALKHGWTRLVRDGLPFCLRIIREMHEILMRGTRGQDKSPGAFRKKNAQIGSDARFIPAPWQEIDDLMNDFEKFVNADCEDEPRSLLKCFVAHYQFEAIHPFEDGNGRVGRALLALMISRSLCHVVPWLYLSLFFERFRREYVDRLFQISANGEWNEWVEFCLRGTMWQASDSIIRVTRLCELKDSYSQRLTSPSKRSHDIIERLFFNPVLSVASIRDALDVSYNTARRDLDRLVEAGIVRELQTKGRHRKYYAPEIMECAFGELEGDIA